MNGSLADARTQPGAADSNGPAFEGGWAWYVGSGEHPEIYGAEEVSRDAAVAYGMDYYAERGFTVIEATKGSMWEYVPDAAHIIDLILESGVDNGAAGDGDLEISADAVAVKAAEDDLNAALKAWYVRHASIFPDTFTFASTRNEQFFPPAASPAEAA